MPNAPHTHNLTATTANEWLKLAIHNILQEYPHIGVVLASSPKDYRPHRQVHPVFFGSLDWHSCVEMYWVAVRLMRLFPGLPAEDRALEVIDSLLTPENIAVEVEYCTARPGFERPYGWGWLLKLAEDLDGWDAPDARRWAETLAPLATLFRRYLAEWLPKLTYAQRIGMHTNTAFALWLALPHIARHDDTLHALVQERALDWFAHDTAYPFAYEPSGADFLSAGLCEAVLMRHVMDEIAFATWIEQFLPVETDWLQPATISDTSDGQLAHLHGLNLSRAWALGELAAVLPQRQPELVSMRNDHIAASIDAVSGSDYMVEHWLVAYALLLHTEPA